MIVLVLTGGQSGCDLAAWKSAKKAGIDTSGFMPRHFLTEDGPRPEYATLYFAVEHDAPDYPSRRRANLEASDGAVVFNRGPSFSPGTKGLLGDRRMISRPVLVVGIPIDWPNRPETVTQDQFIEWLAKHKIGRLMVAGNRESASPGIGAWVESWLDVVFRQIAAGG